jgi:hypothetical protein
MMVLSMAVFIDILSCGKTPWSELGQTESFKRDITNRYESFWLLTIKTITTSVDLLIE